MSELILDPYTLLTYARSIKARQTVLDTNGTAAEADAAFKKIFVVPYTPEWTISALEHYPNLNDLLIELLTIRLEKIEVLRSKKRTEAENQCFLEAIEASERTWEKYELLRRMMAFDSRSLIVEKDHSELSKPRHK